MPSDDDSENHTHYRFDFHWLVLKIQLRLESSNMQSVRDGVRRCVQCV